MKKWAYGLAYYNDGQIEAHGEYMNDMQGESESVAEFLREAGEKGWELCTLLPTKSGTNSYLVFKRPK